jgi:hypothetical protein
MRFRSGHYVIFMLLLAITGACLTRVAAAASACADLPLSALRVYDIKMPVLEELRVPADALNRMPSTDELGSRHTLMLTTNELVTLFEIRHHIVPQADGSLCDAPSLVRIGFGSSRRTAYLARAAAADECVRRMLLAHEDDHTRRFDATVDRFIAQQTGNLKRGLVALKHMPAASAQLAKARWESGLRALVAEAKRQLLSELRAAIAETDTAPALAALTDACGGKVRQLQEGSALQSRF